MDERPRNGDDVYGCSILGGRVDTIRFVRAPAPLPNVIKIDVEGFEDDVLLGLQSTLSSPSLRAVLLEVHFQALQDRGRLTAPIEIEKLFRAKGGISSLIGWIRIT